MNKRSLDFAHAPSGQCAVSSRCAFWDTSARFRYKTLLLAVRSTFGEQGFGAGEVVLGHGPIERHALAGALQQGGAKGGDRLVESRGTALALAERLERSAEIVLCSGPVDRCALSRPLLQSSAIRHDRLR